MEDMNSLYGNFRNRTFSEIFPGKVEFVEQVKTCGLDIDITDASIESTYLLLYSRYGNSVIASSDENRFKYNLYSIMFSYAPTWEKRLDIQKKLRHLTEEDLQRGSSTIINTAANPDDEPTTSSLEELTYISGQTATNFKNSKMTGYAMVAQLLKTDVTENYIKEFSDLFIKIVIPEYPLWYKTQRGGM